MFKILAACLLCGAAALAQVSAPVHGAAAAKLPETWAETHPLLLGHRVIKVFHIPSAPRHRSAFFHNAIAESSYCYSGWPDGKNRCTGTVYWEYFGYGFNVTWVSGPNCYTPAGDQLSDSGWSISSDGSTINFTCVYASGYEVDLLGDSQGGASGYHYIL